MPKTYETIATQTISGSSTSTVTFNSIPQTYTDIVAICVVRSGTTGTNTDNYIRLATGGGAVDSGTNYSTTRLYGDGSSASSDRITSSTLIYGGMIPASGSTAGNLAITIHNIMNYSNTTTNKTILNRGNDALAYVSATIGLWRNTGAITSIQFLTNTNFTDGNTFTLYGIKAD